MRTSRKTAALAAFLALLPAAYPQAAKPQRAADRLVGAWKLVALEGPGGAGPRVTGLLVYTPTGHMSLQMMFGTPARFASDDKSRATPEEIRAAFDAYAAYFGGFSVREAEGLVVHRVEAGLLPNNIGTEQRRYFSFTGNQLILSVTPPGAAQQGMRLVWERLE